MLDFDKIFADYVASDQKTWSVDRSKTSGASETGQCLRKTWYKKNDYPKDKDYVDSWGALRRGDVMEGAYIVPAITHGTPAGVQFLYAGKDQKTLVSGYLSATLDGLLTGLPKDALSKYGVDDIESDCIITEFKSNDPGKKMEEPNPGYIIQVQQQLHLVHELTEHRPEYAVIISVDASWYDKIHVFVIKRDPAIGEACVKRGDLIFTTTDPKELPPEGKLAGGKDCSYCPYQNQCSLAQIGRMPTQKTNSTLNEAGEVKLRILVEAYKDAMRAIKDQTLIKTGAAESIKQFLREQNQRFSKTNDGYSVSYSTRAGRKTLDVEAMEKDGIDLEKYRKEGNPSESLRVTMPGADEED